MDKKNHFFCCECGSSFEKNDARLGGELFCSECGGHLESESERQLFQQQGDLSNSFIDTSNSIGLILLALGLAGGLIGGFIGFFT